MRSHRSCRKDEILCIDYPTCLVCLITIPKTTEGVICWKCSLTNEVVTIDKTHDVTRHVISGSSIETEAGEVLVGSSIVVVCSLEPDHIILDDTDGGTL